MNLSELFFPANFAFDEILSMDVQFIVLGTGDDMYENNFRGKEYAYRNKMRAIIKYDDYFASTVSAFIKNRFDSGDSIFFHGTFPHDNLVIVSVPSDFLSGVV